jgi:hypothetical protein
MNLLKHTFVLILLLLAGLQVGAAHGEGSKTAGDFKYCLLNNSFNQPSWELDLIAYFRPIQELQKYSDTTSQYISPCDQIPEEEAFTSPPGSLAPKVLCMLAEDLAKFPELRKLFDSAENVGGKFVKAWEKLITVQGIRTSVKSIETVSTWIEDGIELTFKKGGDNIATIVSKNGDEAGEFVKDGANEYLIISDDYFVTSGTPKSFGSVTVNVNTGEILSNVGYVKNADGLIGFIEDVSAYGNATIQNAIKKRGDLRKDISGILADEDAHHLFPIQTLKENQWIKKGVEGGFEFNRELFNGIKLKKYSKATNTGRHGPHPNYTEQINNHMNWWAEQIGVNGTKNKFLSNEDTATYMNGLANSLRNRITSSSSKINELNLNLPQ